MGDNLLLDSMRALERQNSIALPSDNFGTDITISDPTHPTVQMFGQNAFTITCPSDAEGNIRIGLAGLSTETDRVAAGVLENTPPAISTEDLTLRERRNLQGAGIISRGQIMQTPTQSQLADIFTRRAEGEIPREGLPAQPQPGDLIPIQRFARDFCAPGS